MHIQQLETAGDVDITWLSRDGRPAGTTTLLQDALVAAPWVSDDVYAWVAGEALTLAPIRRWLRTEKALPRGARRGRRRRPARAARDRPGRRDPRRGDARRDPPSRSPAAELG
ncbi:SIP domain-containing protein [Microbacterium lacticum]|uniref:SIP domain-containing protein n=1 Tax=Microbacterium lacticum TaxID=33885 RepID=UPI003A87F17E